MESEVLYAMAGGLDGYQRDLHAEIDELAIGIEVAIREFGDTIENAPDFPPRASKNQHSAIVSPEDMA